MLLFTCSATRLCSERLPEIFAPIIASLIDVIGIIKPCGATVSDDAISESYHDFCTGVPMTDCSMFVRREVDCEADTQRRFEEAGP